MEDTAAPVAWPGAPSPRPQAATSEWQPEGEGAGTPAGELTGALADGDDRPATYGAWLVEPREDEPAPRSAEERDGAASVPAITVDDGAPPAGLDAAAFVVVEAAPLDAAVTQFDEYGEAAKAVAIDVDVMEEETTGPENPADPAAGADSAPDILHAGSVSNESPPERGPLRPEDDGTAKNGQTFERAEDGASGRLESPGSLPEPSGAPPWPPGSPSPETAEDDDPWAAFLSARESEGTVPFASPATVTPGAPVSWGMDAPDAPIGERDGDGLAAAPATTEDDDPWAAVVAASGYDDTASGSGQVYFKRRDGSVTPPFQPAETGEPAPDPIEAPDARAEIERRLFEPEIEFEPQPAPAAMEPEGDEWLREPFAAAETTAFTTDFATLPAADFWEDENDVVLKAFLEKANAAEDEDEAEALGSPESGPLEALFGRQAAEIEDEFSEPEPQRPSFAQAPPWAQPRSPGTSASVPSSLMRVVEPDEWTPPPQAGADGRSFGPMPPEPLPFGPFDDDERIPAASGARSRGKTLIRELVETGLLALLVFLAVRASFQNFKVDGNSMFPTLENGQFLIVNKLVYSEVDLDKLASFLPFVDVGTEPKRHVFHPPERGDIVVLRDPRRPDTDLIKRVVGLPGETIEIVDGKVAINGFRLEEPYIKTQWHYNMPRSTIPAGQYFVMGDNRDNSLDSRSAQVGPVPEELIIGKTMVSYWPSEKFGLAPNGNPKVTEEPLSASTKQATAP